MNPEPIVFIVDDDPITRLMLAKVLETANLRVEAYASARDFLERHTQHYRTDRNACLLLDIQMPEMTGPELQKEMQARGIDLPIIMMSATADVPTAVGVMKSGAMDLFEKPVPRDPLLDRIRQAMELHANHRRQQIVSAAVREALSSLTPRERQVMDLAVAGLANKQIAAKLGLSEKTVEVHRGHVMHKTRTQSFADLVRMSIAVGERKAA